MQQTDELKRLIKELGDSQSALDRLRLVGQAWRLLRDLTAGERADVAATLGIEGAEEIVERLAQSKGGRTPLVLLEGLRALRHADPGEVRWLLKRLRDAGDRRELALEGVKAAAQRVIIAPPVAVAPEAPRKPARPSVRVTSAQPKPPTVAPPIKPEASTPAPLVPVREQESPLVTRLDAKPEAERPRAPGVPAESVPASPAREAPVSTPSATPPASITAPGPQPRPVAPEPDARPAPSPEPAAAPPKAAAAPTGAQTGVVMPAPPPTRAELFAMLGRLPSDLARLSRLRVLLGSTRRPWDPERLEVVRAFRDGWLRRRAVESLIEHGAVAVPAQALALVAQLTDEWDRLVCLDALARRGGVEKEAALQLANSTHARRRIGRWRHARMGANRT